MLKKMGIQKRLLVSYAIFVAMLMIVGAVSVRLISRVGNNLSGFYDYQHQTMIQSWTARQTADASIAEAMQSMLDSDPTITQNAIEKTRENFDSVKMAVESIKNTYQGDESDLAEIESILDYAAPLLEEICNLAEQNRKDEAYEILKTKYQAAMDSLREWLVYVGEVSDYHAQLSIYDGEIITQIATIVIVLMIAFGVIAAVFLGAMIAKSIRKPVEELKIASEQMSKGQLNISLDYKSEDELGDLTKSMQMTMSGLAQIIGDIRYILRELATGNFFVQSKDESLYKGDYQEILISLRDTRDTMEKTLSQINSVAESVDEGSTQVASAAQELSRGAEEQVSSVQKLVSTVDGVVKQIELTNQYATEASVQAREAGNKTEECNEQMKQMVEAMNDISDTSEKIKNIISSIENIAVQTKLLAVNASIEAARAGEAGKGFAVVAGQVNTLAAMSSQASQDTVTLVLASLQAVEHGVSLVNETAGKLQSVSDNAITIADMVKKIAENSQEQTAYVEQISDGIEEISEITQVSSASSEESTATSEALSKQAKMLKELVEQFKLRSI